MNDLYKMLVEIVGPVLAESKVEIAAERIGRLLVNTLGSHLEVNPISKIHWSTILIVLGQKRLSLLAALWQRCLGPLVVEMMEHFMAPSPIDKQEIATFRLGFDLGFNVC